EGLNADKMPGMRLHLRAMLRDGQDVFVGSQSLRALELDKRREVGIIVKDRAVAKRFRDVFEGDWAKTDVGKELRKAAEKDKEKDREKEKDKDEKRQEAVAS